MIPLQLTIKGLYSYQQETVIDFNHLTSSGLFGIFGAVGSGKSTILEAITFALYGETERLNNSDKRSYNMMNLKSNELLIEFEFETGHPAQRFKFVVKCRRNRNHFEKQSAFERKSYQWEQEIWVPTSKTAEQILGLSYPNFKRTIIIPQGKFQEFLQLTDGERVKMLKEIFNLEKFELSAKAATLNRDNDLKISSLQGLMGGLPEYTPELLQEKEAAIQLLTKETSAKQSFIQQKEKEEKTYTELKSLANDKEEKEKQYGELQTRKAEFDSLEKELAEFEKCQQLFQDLLSNRDKIEQEHKQRSGELLEIQRQLTEVVEEVETKQKKKTELADAYNSREHLLRKGLELEEVLLLQSLVAKEADIIAKIAGVKAKLQKEEVLEEESQNNLESLKTEAKNLEAIVPDTANLMFLQSLYTQRGTLVDRINETNDAVEVLNRKKKKFEEERSVWVDRLTQELELTTVNSPLDSILEIGSFFVLKEKAVFQTCQDQLTELKAHRKLEEFSSTLKPGEPCPLCGSVEHPHLYAAVDAEKQIAEKEEEMRGISTKVENIALALKNINNASLSIQPLESQILGHGETLASCSEILASQRTALAEKGLDESTLEKAIEEAKVNMRELDRLRDKIENESEKLKKISKCIQDFRSGVESLEREMAAKEAEIKIRKEKVQSLPWQDEIKKTESEILVAIAALKERHSLVSKNYEENEKQLQNSQKQQEKLNGSSETLTSVVKDLSLSLSKMKNEISALLEQHGIEEDNVKRTLAKKLDVAAYRKKIATYCEQLHTASVQLEDAIGKLDGRTYDETSHKELSASIYQLKIEHKELNEQLIGERKDLDKLMYDMEKRKVLQIQLDSLLQRAENLKVLLNLFRSSGFVNYVSSVYLQNLINAANERFHKMTRQHLMLELTDKNDFEVRDFMNNGQVRSVKTLSGGQTFQAALSLALALADNIQHLTHSSQNFFFLDEGFGSLDKEALGIVFQTLKSLKKENRIVGVISHVDEMQQEIHVNLRVTNDPEQGSWVEKSWG